MPRLYLMSIVFLLLCENITAQTNLGSYLKYAEEKYKKGDYYYAIELYEKAMAIDSNSITTLWNYAETLRAYKDYRKAAYYYAKVFEREEGTIYPMALLYLGLMQKHNGNYDAAIQTFKKVKTNYGKDKKAYIYLKSKRELESCLWAKSTVQDSAKITFTHLPENVNSKDSEFGHTFNDNTLYFSSLKADSINSAEEVYAKSYKTRLYKTTKKGMEYQAPSLMKELNTSLMNTGNGSFSEDKSRFYYSLCNDVGFSYRCKIMVATYVDGRVSRIDSLGPIVNSPGSNTTMPFISKLNGVEVLFFASDRKDGLGGMDLWYTELKNSSQFSKPINLKSLNSIDNELSPWFDTVSQQLYFSSSWHDGFGGYDIFKSQYNEKFESPINVGQPYNSSANDLYYFQNGDTAYFSSNRKGVNFSKNPTCCSDIFSAYPLSPPPIETTDSFPIPKQETLMELSKRLPVTLYFHNDCPDPKSRDTVSQVNYLSGYQEYRGMLEKYQNEYSSGLETSKATAAREEIENFFIEYVDKGVKDLSIFTELLLKEVQQGSRINLTIKGFASPLAKTDYNVTLTKRRISSLENYLRAYENGVFIPFLEGTSTNGGYVRITQIPFGEYTANKLTSDNFHDQKNSIYSRAAAIERKIEIQSVDFIKEDRLSFLTRLTPAVLQLGRTDTNLFFNKILKLESLSTDTLLFERFETEGDYFEMSIPQLLEPLKTLELQITQKKPFPQGLFSIQSRIYFVGHERPLLMVINGEQY
jgi:tetratricopeptide (TPR) repeat protein